MAGLTKTLTIFNYNGKNYIGYYCDFGTDAKPSFVGIAQNINNVYVFLAPAEITYELQTTSDATADLISKVMPIFPAAFYKGNADQIYFAVPKSDIVLSNIKDSTIHENIQKQYKQLTKL